MNPIIGYQNFNH